MADKTGYNGALDSTGAPIPLKYADNGDGTFSPAPGAGLVPGTGATSLGKAEDAAHTSGDTGVMLLAVRKDTAAALAGTDGDYIPVIVDSSGRLHIAALVAGENHIGEVGGNSTRITPSITVDTAAYAAGDTVGGKITLANALRAAGAGTVLTDIHILDRSNQKPTGSILIFNADLSAATTTDNAAFVYSTDDLKEIARIGVASSDYTTINSKAVAHLRGLNCQCSAASGTSLYAVFVTDGAPDFVAGTDLQISFGFLRD